MKLKPPFYLVLLFLLIEAYPALPQEIFFNKVLPPEGKKFRGITRIAQDKQGYMWFATQRGLFRYDGYQMISYKDDPVTPSNKLLTFVCPDSGGIIWIGTWGSGLARFDPSDTTFKHFRYNANDASSLSDDTITAILRDRQGILWIGTHRGLNRLDSKTGNFIHYFHRANDPASLSSNQVRALYEDHQGTLWIGTGSPYPGEGGGPEDGGLNRLDKKTGKFIRFLHDPNDPHSLINNKVTAIFEDSKGNLWVGTGGDGLHSMDRTKGTFERYLYDLSHPEKLSRPPLSTQVTWDHIAFVTEDAAGAIWIGTAYSGLNYYNTKTKKITYYGFGKDTAGSLPDNEIVSACTSREGVLWIGTFNGSLYRVDPFHRNIPHYASPGSSIVESFLEEAGTLWIGTEEGLFRKDLATGTVKRYVHDPLNPASLGNNYIQYILKDRQGNLWIATHGGLDLFNKDNESFTHYQHNSSDNNSLSANHVGLIYENPDANLWIATSWGLNMMDRKTGKFTRYFFDPRDTRLGGDNITYVLKDRLGNLWVGTWSGLHRLNPQNGKFKDYLKGNDIYSLCEDTQGNLWVGGNYGLYLYNRTSDVFTRFVEPGPQTEMPEVISIAEDDQRNLWICSSVGLVKLNPQRSETILYGSSFGVKDLELTYCHKGPRDRLYFSNQTGYFAFYPAEIIGNVRQPEIVLTSFRLANQVITTGKQGPLIEPLSQTKEIRLRYDQNVFSFDFTAFDYSNPQSNRHFFMLEHYDNEWRTSGTERRAYYFNVPPGKYTFRVKAANSYGIRAEKSIDVIITPPWWSTWWFRITAVFCGLVSFYGIIRWRIYQKFHLRLERSEKEKQLAEFQHQKSELEMQALRAQMNPHFIFNCLSSINGFILKNETEPASEYLVKFSRLIRMVLTNSKRAFITLEDELEMLRLYLEMERLRFQYSFDYKISFQNEIDPENIFIPPLLLQPFAENAIWHGLMHKKGKGYLEIALSLEKKILTCWITDNGIGRSNAALIKSKSAEKQKSMGLQITKERLALLNRDIDVQTFFNIEDITNEEGNPSGTRVILKINYKDLTEVPT